MCARAGQQLRHAGARACVSGTCARRRRMGGCASAPGGEAASPMRGVQRLVASAVHLVASPGKLSTGSRVAPAAPAVAPALSAGSRHGSGEQDGASLSTRAEVRTQRVKLAPLETRPSCRPCRAPSQITEATWFGTWGGDDEDPQLQQMPQGPVEPGAGGLGGPGRCIEQLHGVRARCGSKHVVPVPDARPRAVPPRRLWRGRRSSSSAGWWVRGSLGASFVRWTGGRTLLSR